MDTKKADADKRLEFRDDVTKSGTAKFTWSEKFTVPRNTKKCFTKQVHMKVSTLPRIWCCLCDQAPYFLVIFVGFATLDMVQIETFFARMSQIFVTSGWIWQRVVQAYRLQCFIVALYLQIYWLLYFYRQTLTTTIQRLQLKWNMTWLRSTLLSQCLLSGIRKCLKYIYCR